MVGTQKEFFTWDMSVMPPGEKTITATCRAVGEHAYVFVDDAVWERLVTEEDVFEVDRKFHRQAPPGAVDPRQGIAEINHAYFGEAPLGLDSDPKINILITEFASFRNTTLNGYFNPFDTIPDSQAQEQYGQRSNEAEVIYLNAASRRISGDYMQAVLAHEHMHLLHHPHDPIEEAWMGEMLGEVAMKVNGYHTDMGQVARHQAHPDRPLVSQTYVDYGACMLFGSYLTEQFGEGFIQELASSPLQGVESLNATLENLGQNQRFEGLFRNWVVANLADSKGVATPGLHYGTLDLPAPAVIDLSGAETETSDSLRPTGARYYRLPEAATSLEIASETPGLQAEIVSFQGKRLERLDLTTNEGLVELPSNGGERYLALSSLGDEELNYQLRWNEAPPSA